MDTNTPPPEPPLPSTTPPMPPAPPMAGNEDKTVAIVSYLTLIGFIAAIVINSNKKTRLGAFHLRQMLGFALTCIAAMFCYIILIFIPILGWLAAFAIWISLFVLWVMGLISAINGEMKPMPVVGPLYQQWFGTTFE